MARVPITVMGYRCDRCQHEWLPRNSEAEPLTCPRCKSPYWNRPKKAHAMTTYEHFRDSVERILKEADRPLTWTEVRTIGKMPQAFPNNKWVHDLEKHIGLERTRDKGGIIHWRLKAQAAQ